MRKGKHSYTIVKGTEDFYGIACFDEFSKKVTAVEDISDDRGAVEAFCEMLNATGVEPCHFEEIYDDYFG